MYIGLIQKMAFVLVCFYTSVAHAQNHAYTSNLDFSSTLEKEFYSESEADSERPRADRVLRQVVHRLKEALNISLTPQFKVKITRIKSGPLSQEITQLVPMSSGLQSRDGFEGEASKGYGLKITLLFD